MLHMLVDDSSDVRRAAAAIIVHQVRIARSVQLLSTGLQP